MLEKILQLISVACAHRRLSKPFTAAGGNASKDAEWEPVGSGPAHYVVCLECGRKFAYDWANMRVVR